MKWDSFVPKAFKRGLVQCVLHRAWNICSDYQRFNTEVQHLKSLLLANGYPLNFLESCISKYINSRYTPASNPVYGPDKKTVTVSLPFCGINSYRLRRQLSRMYSTVLPWLSLRIVFRPTNKLGKLCKLKSQFNILQLSNVIYMVNCKDCQAQYVGLTTRRLKQRLHEHASQESSALYGHSVEQVMALTLRILQF